MNAFQLYRRQFSHKETS